MKRNTLTVPLSSLIVAAIIFTFGCERVQVGPSEELGMETTGEAKPEDAGEEEAEVKIPPPSTPGTMATITIGKAQYNVEIAETAEELKRGLMDRESLPPNFGMWFVFPQNTRDPFWMKDTLVPLDIIYVDEDMKIVHINPNTVPGSTELLYSPVSYRFVLEVPADTAKKDGINVGDTVQFTVGGAP